MWQQQQQLLQNQEQIANEKQKYHSRMYLLMLYYMYDALCSMFTA